VKQPQDVMTVTPAELTA